MNRLKQTSKKTITLEKGKNKRRSKFKGYEIGSLTSSFAFKWDENDEKEGITEWFNYKGLTYIQE